MSLLRPTVQIAELGPLGTCLPPPEDPDFQPPQSKRLRLEESGGASEARWRLPLVPRLSEVEKFWELLPRSFEALFISTNVNCDYSIDSCVAQSASGRQICHLGWQKSKFQMNSCLHSLSSQKFGCGLRASGRPFEQEPKEKEVFSLHSNDRFQAEVGQSLPSTSIHDIHGVKNENGKQYLAQGRSNSRKDNRYIKQAENPFLDATFYKEAKATPHEIKNRCKANSVMSSNKKENILASILKIPKSPSQHRLEIAKPCYFRDNNTSIPEFPTDLNSKMSSVYLKEIAKEKNGKSETYVRDFTNVYCSQYRPDAKRQKLQNDNTIVDAENTLSEYCESNHQSLSYQNTCKEKKDVLSLNYYNRSSIKCDIKVSEKNSTIILENSKAKETKICPDSYKPIRLEKSQSWYCITRCIWKRNRKNNWIMSNCKTIYENMEINGGRLNSQQLLEIDFLNKEDYHNTRVMNACGEQSKTLMIGTLGRQKVLIKNVCLSGKEENDNILQLRYYAIQNGSYLSNAFQSFSTGVLCFHKTTSESQKYNSNLTWSETLKHKKKIEIQNLIIRNLNVDTKNDVLSIYLQTGVSKTLNIILKTNNSLECLIKFENEFKLGEEHIFKWIVYLNYPKMITVENHSASQIRILTFSPLVEDNMRPVLKKKRKLFQTEEVSKGSKKETSNSFNMTAEMTCLPVFQTDEKIPLLMDFDGMNDIFWTKEISYKDNCPKGVMNVENWAHFSPVMVKTDSKSGPLFIWDYKRYINENSYEISMHNQDSDTERKQEHSKITGFSSECISQDFFNIKQQTISASHLTICSQTNAKIITQLPNFENLLCEIKETNYDLVLEEIKTTAQNLTNSCQVHKDFEIETEKKDDFSSTDAMLSVQSVSLMSKVNVEDTIQPNQIYVTQNNTNRNEFESSLQESELDNSKHFQLKNDSTACVNHQFEADLSAGNNEWFQDLNAKCLSTEALTIGKDFEMRSKFDLVLEELRMFHEISKKKEILSTVETNTEQENYIGENNGTEEVEKQIKKDLKVATVNKTCASSLICETKATPRRHQSLFKWKTESSDGEQAVPSENCCPRTPEEELFYSTSEEDCEKLLPERLALFPEEFKEGKCNYLLKGGSNFSNGILRVHPLKTCSRPIRIGLSRKAKLKQLHPYLK